MLHTVLTRLTRGTWIGRYLVALGSVTFVILLRVVLQRFLGNDVPFLLLFTAVLVSAGYGGLGPGLVATLVGAIAASLFLMNPQHSGWIGDQSEQTQMGRFLIEGFLISVLGAGLDSARRRALQSEAETRQLEQRILDISDDERRRIGQDLHDGLGQHLTGVAFLTKALEQRLINSSRPEAEEATRIASLVSDSIGQTRALARGLAPIGLEEGGLTTSLTQLASTTSTVFGIACNFRGESGIEVNDLGISTHLYRIAQEAVTNSVRHGKASKIDIDLDRQDKALRLLIRDNGVGMPSSTENGGMGLQIMTFRAKMVGGSLAVVRREGGGTVVACTVPF